MVYQYALECNRCSEIGGDTFVPDVFPFDEDEDLSNFLTDVPVRCTISDLGTFMVASV